MTHRIAYARIAQETHAFSPVETTLADFQRQHWLEGDALARVCRPLGNEAPGWTPLAELSGFVAAARLSPHRRDIEAVPLTSAWALPSGPVSDATIEALRARLEASLRGAGKLDGVLLSMHGAMRGKGTIKEPEELFLQTVRDVVGPDVPIALTLDLHGQLTPALIDGADSITAYRTNPHRDLFQTGFRAGKLLIKTVRGGVAPTMAWRALPMVLGGGTTLDFLGASRPLFRHMKALERDPRVLAANLFMCHLWNDSPDLGWSTCVVTDGDQDLAERLADGLAERAWAVREIPPPSFVGPGEAIRAVRASRIRRRTGAFCFCDASDVVGAGATGENTHLLRALLEEGQGLVSYVPLLDSKVARTLFDQPSGSRVDIKVGGALDPEMYPPVQVRGTVAGKSEVGGFGKRVALDLGHVKLVVSELPPFNLRPTFFSQMGLSPGAADIMVVKSFFHFRIFYWPWMRGSMTVKTRGLTDLDMVERVAFNDPVHPMVDVKDWRPIDRRRRGV